MYIEDALLRPEIVWMDHFSAGRAQSLGDDGDEFRPRPTGRYVGVAGICTIHNDGGPEDGGYLEATNLTTLSVAPATTLVGDYAVLVGDLEPLPKQGTMLSTHDLRGRTIAVPEAIQRFDPHVEIQVMPDHTLRAVTLGVSNTVIATGTFAVPATGRFTLESEMSVSPNGYNKGGFVQTNVYMESLPVVGVRALRAVGVKTRRDFTFPLVIEDITSYQFVMQATTRISGAAIARPTGTVRGFLYDGYPAPAWPSAPGDSAESTITQTRIEPVADYPTLTTVLRWATDARWDSLLTKVASVAEGLDQDWGFGEVGLFGGSFVPPAPHIPPVDLDTLHRIQLRDDALDFYRVTLDRTDVRRILAFGPAALAGYRQIVSNIDNGFGAGTRLYTLTNDDSKQDSGDRQQMAYQLMMKMSGGLVVPGRVGMALPQQPGDVVEWRTFANYNFNPNSYHVLNPETSARLDPAHLPQVGAQGYFPFIDGNDPPYDPADRWIDVSLRHLMLDVFYQKRIPDVIESPDRAPIADFRTLTLNLPAGDVTVYDASVDFNGTISDLITGIVSRVVDWGDGGSDPITVSGTLGAISHHYAVSGTYTATETVTNAAGLSATAQLTFIVPAATPIAGFTAATNGGDMSGLTIDFTDASSIVVGTIVSRAWDFGDGGTSTATNPTHTYAAPGDYDITLTVTSDTAATDDDTEPLTVPIVVGGGGCGFTATALADTVSVMGDDFAGGNPPLTAWPNTAAFAGTAYDQTPYRGYYDIFFPTSNDGVDFSIDTVKTFNARNTLKQRYGQSPHFSGGGWNIRISDDGSPTEHFPPAAPYSATLPITCATRRILSVDPALAAALTTPGAFNGLELISHIGFRWFVSLLIRNGSVWLDVQTHESDPAATTTNSFDLGIPDTTFLQSGFGEALLYTEADEGGHTLRVMVWAGMACSLGGASPLKDTSKPAFWNTNTHHLAQSDVGFGNYFFTPPAIDAFTNDSVGEVHTNIVVADVATRFGVSLT